METAPTPNAELESKPDLFIVTNGVAFRAEEMEPKLADLAKLTDQSGQSRWGNVATIPTTADDTYLEELVPQITPGSTIVISGGDGTVKRTLLALRQGGFTGEEIDILITGAGNKNDVARMLHGKQHVSDPLSVLDRGRKTTIFPVEATMTDSEGSFLRTEEFIYHFGAIASALAIKMANEPKFRNKQRGRGPLMTWFGDHKLGLDAALQVPPVETSKGKLKDYMVVAGEEAAGGKAKFRLTKGSKKLSIRLTNPTEILTAETKANIASMLGNAIGRKLGLSLSDRWHSPYETIRIDGEAPAQADGEILEPIPAGTTIRFQRSAQGIAVLALR